MPAMTAAAKASTRKTTRRKKATRKPKPRRRAEEEEISAVVLLPEDYEYPVGLNMLPPIAFPFTKEVCLHWLDEECVSTFQACRWGLAFAKDAETRNAFAMLHIDAETLTAAAIETVVRGKPKRPVELATSGPDWTLATAQLAAVVRSGLVDRSEASTYEPPLGFNTLALILEQRLKLIGLDEDERVAAAGRLTFPVAERAGESTS